MKFSVEDSITVYTWVNKLACFNIFKFFSTDRMIDIYEIFLDARSVEKILRHREGVGHARTN